MSGCLACMPMTADCLQQLLTSILCVHHGRLLCWRAMMVTAHEPAFAAPHPTHHHRQWRAWPTRAVFPTCHPWNPLRSTLSLSSSSRRSQPEPLTVGCAGKHAWQKAQGLSVWHLCRAHSRARCQRISVSRQRDDGQPITLAVAAGRQSWRMPSWYRLPMASVGAQTITIDSSSRINGARRALKCSHQKLLGRLLPGIHTLIEPQQAGASE